MPHKFEWLPEYRLSGGVDRLDAYTTGPFGLELHVQRSGKEWKVWGPGRWPDYNKLTEIHPKRRSAIKEAERYFKQELKDWIETDASEVEKIKRFLEGEEDVDSKSHSG